MRAEAVAVPVLVGALAALHAAAALGKLADLPGFVAVLAEYRLLPALLLWPAALLVVASEAAIAAGLLRPAWRRPAALASAALAAAYGTALLITLARGIALENCGCFGVYLARPLTPLTPLEDALLVAAALLLARLSRPAGARREAA